MGRTGKWWGWQNYSVKPDLFTSAKSLADGVPMGALVSNAKFADVFTAGAHASTFGGNPLASAAALAVIKIIEDEKLLDAAVRKGELLREGLKGFVEKYAKILDVRGTGCMLGMVVDGDPKEIVDAFQDMGILALTAHGNVVRFLPTLSMSESHIEEAVELMGDALDGLYGDAE
jgi:acetylornithine/succinyldiaminopimelate/putrescine aminotransferase